MVAIRRGERRPCNAARHHGPMNRSSTIYKWSIGVTVLAGAALYALARQWFGEDTGTATAAVVAMFALVIALIPVTTPPDTRDPEVAFQEVVMRRIMGNAHLAAVLAGAGLTDVLWPKADAKDPWHDVAASLFLGVIPLAIILLAVLRCTVAVIRFAIKRSGH